MKPLNQEKLILLRELWAEYQSFDQNVEIQGVMFRMGPDTNSAEGKRHSYLIHRIDDLLWELLPDIVKEDDAIQDG